MINQIKWLPFTLLIQCFVFYSCNTPNITQPEYQSMSNADWKEYLSRPFIEITINKGSIAARPYMSSFDTVTTIDSVSLDFAVQDSNLLNDSLWYSCKYRIRSSCYGEPIFYRQDTSAIYPHFVVVRYRLNKNDFLTDTIQINPAIEFINTSTISKVAINSDTFIFSATWNATILNQYYAPYMVIAIDNGLVGAEYYESHPNFDNLPETPQPPEGYKTMYARFNPEDNAFSFQSYQNLMPFMRTTYTIKRYSSFDIRATINISGNKTL